MQSLKTSSYGQEFDLEHNLAREIHERGATHMLDSILFDIELSTFNHLINIQDWLDHKSIQPIRKPAVVMEKQFYAKLEYTKALIVGSWKNSKQKFQDLLQLAREMGLFRNYFVIYPYFTDSNKQNVHLEIFVNLGFVIELLNFDLLKKFFASLSQKNKINSIDASFQYFSPRHEPLFDYNSMRKKFSSIASMLSSGLFERLPLAPIEMWRKRGIIDQYDRINIFCALDIANRQKKTDVDYLKNILPTIIIQKLSS